MNLHSLSPRPTLSASTSSLPARWFVALLLGALYFSFMVCPASGQFRQDDPGDTLQFVRRQPLPADTVPQWRRIWGVGAKEFYIGATLQVLRVNGSQVGAMAWLDTALGIRIVEKRGWFDSLLLGTTMPTVVGSDTVWGRRLIGATGFFYPLGWARELFFYPFDSTQSSYWWNGFLERSGGVSATSPYRDIWRQQKRTTRYDTTNTMPGDTILKHLVFDYDPALHNRRWPQTLYDATYDGVEDAAGGLARARLHPILGTSDNPPAWFFGVQAHLIDPILPYGGRAPSIGLDDTVLMVTIWCEVPGTHQHWPYRGAGPGPDNLHADTAQQDTNYLYYAFPILKRDLLPDTTNPLGTNWDEFFEKTEAVNLVRINDSSAGGPLHPYNSGGSESGGRFDIRVVWTGKEPVALRSIVMRDTVGQLLVGNLGKGDSAFQAQQFVATDQLLEGPWYGNTSPSGRTNAQARIDTLRQKLIRIFCGDEAANTMFVGYNWADTALARRYGGGGAEDRGLRAWHSTYGRRAAWTMSSENENTVELYGPAAGSNGDEMQRLGLPRWRLMLPAIREHNGGRFGIDELQIDSSSVMGGTLLDTIALYTRMFQRAELGASFDGHTTWGYERGLRGFGSAAYVSRRTGRPFIPWPGSFRVLSVTWRTDTPLVDKISFAPLQEAAELRVLFNLALCYGARGVHWYSLGAGLNEFGGSDIHYPGGVVRNNYRTDWGPPGPDNGDTTNHLYPLTLFRGDSLAAALYTVQIDSFYTGWGVMSNELKSLHKQQVPRLWPYLEPLRWRDSYSMHFTTHQSYYGPGDTVNQQSRPLDTNEIVRSVRTWDRYGRLDSLEETYVELGLFDSIPGTGSYDTNHIYLVNRRTFERPSDVNPASTRGKKMDSLAEWRRVFVGLQIPHVDSARYSYVRVRELAADTTRAPWMTSARSGLDTIISTDSAIALWMRPGGGALLKITPLQPGDTVNGVLAYNNSHKIVFDGVRYHAVYTEFEPNLNDTTSIYDVVWYRWSQPVVTGPYDPVIHWSGAGSGKLPISTHTFGNPCDYEQRKQNRHPSLSVRHVGDSTLATVVWTCHPIASVPPGTPPREVVSRSIMLDSGGNVASVGSMETVSYFTGQWLFPTPWGTPVVSSYDGAEVFAWSDSVAGIMAKARTTGFAHLPCMPSWLWSTMINVDAATPTRSGAGSFPTMSPLAHITSLDSNAGIAYQIPIAPTGTAIGYARLVHFPGGGGTPVLADTLHTVISMGPGLVFHPSLDLWQDVWGQCFEGVAWEEVQIIIPPPFGPPSITSTLWFRPVSIETRRRAGWDSLEWVNPWTPYSYTVRTSNDTLAFVWPNAAAMNEVTALADSADTAHFAVALVDESSTSNRLWQTRIRYGTSTAMPGYPKQYSYSGYHPMLSTSPIRQDLRAATLYESDHDGNDGNAIVNPTHQFFSRMTRPRGYLAVGRELRVLDTGSIGIAAGMLDLWISDEDRAEALEMTPRASTRDRVETLTSALALVRSAVFTAHDSVQIGLRTRAHFAGDSIGAVARGVALEMRWELVKEGGSVVAVLDSARIDAMHQWHDSAVECVLDLVSGNYSVRMVVDTVGVVPFAMRQAESRWPVAETSIWVEEMAGKMVRTGEAKGSRTRLDVQPNPATERIEVMVSVSEERQVSVRLYTVEGRLVQELYSGMLERGRYSLPVTLSNLSSGSYLVELTAGATRLNRRLVVR